MKGAEMNLAKLLYEKCFEASQGRMVAGKIYQFTVSIMPPNGIDREAELISPCLVETVPTCEGNIQNALIHVGETIRLTFKESKWQEHSVSATIKGYRYGWIGLWDHFKSLLFRRKIYPIHDYTVSLSFYGSGIISNATVVESSI
jgi:hypothetical protein